MGRGVLVDAMTTEQLTFRNLTLGYDRHPAVHHLDSAVLTGSLTAVAGLVLLDGVAEEIEALSVR